MVITLTNTYKFIDFHLCFHIIFLLYFIYIFTIYHNKNTNWFLELILISLLQSFCFSSVESVQCMRLEGNINPVLITKTGVVKRCSGLISLLWGTKGLQGICEVQPLEVCTGAFLLLHSSFQVLSLDLGLQRVMN